MHMISKWTPTTIDEHIEEARMLAVVLGVQLGAVEHPRDLLFRVHVALTQTPVMGLPVTWLYEAVLKSVVIFTFSSWLWR